MKGRLILSAAVAAVLLAALIPPSPAAARPPGGVYVKGEVTRARRPVRSAWVILAQNGQEKGRSLTGDDGRYYIGDLNAGEYQVVIKQGPRNVFEGRVRLPEDKDYNVQVRGN